MDLTTLDALETSLPAWPGAAWRPGDAWLAGGTWLFSEPQPRTSRLLDLTAQGWAPLSVQAEGLTVAATCTITELYSFAGALPAGWTVGPLIRRCCEAFVASFKIWNLATVGGNLCNALPAGPMISLSAGLGATCTIWAPDGSVRELPAADFVVGDNRHALEPGELLRSIRIPPASLTAATAFRQVSLTTYGRSAALLIGRTTPAGLSLTVTASVRRPVVLDLSGSPTRSDVVSALDAGIAPADYHDDMHGDPRWRRHLTYQLAEQLRAELATRP